MFYKRQKTLTVLKNRIKDLFCILYIALKKFHFLLILCCGQSSTALNLSGQSQFLLPIHVHRKLPSSGKRHIFGPLIENE